VAAGRLASVWVARVWKPQKMVTVATAGLVASGIVSAVFAMLRFHGSVGIGVHWLAALMIGASMSTIFPSTMSLTDYYASLEGKHTTALVVGASLGEMAVPIVIGAAMVADPGTMPYVILAVIIGEALLLLIGTMLGLHLHDRRLLAARAHANRDDSAPQTHSSTPDSLEPAKHVQIELH
jgi:fucose permease